MGRKERTKEGRKKGGQGLWSKENIQFAVCNDCRSAAPSYKNLVQLICSKGWVYLAVVALINKEIASVQIINEIGLVNSPTVPRMMRFTEIEAFIMCRV